MQLQFFLPKTYVKRKYGAAYESTVNKEGGETNAREKEAAAFCRELDAHLSTDRLDKKRHRRSGGVDPVWNLWFSTMPLGGRRYLSMNS